MLPRKAVIIATGPSLTKEDVQAAFLSLRHVIVINDAYTLVKFPLRAILYACDLEWWDHHINRISDRFMPWTINDEAARRYGLNHIHGKNGQGNGVHFSTDPDYITTGANSGFQALNLAYKLGFRDVVLIGYDMGHESGEKSHFFGDHPLRIRRPSPYHSFRKAFEKAAPAIKEAGMKVVNSSRSTRLECFPRVALETAL